METKKCIFITPTGVSMKLKSGTVLMPNSKTPAMATTKEILNALNAGIRVLELVGTSQIRLDKSNYMINFNATPATTAPEVELNEIVADIAKTLEVPVPTDITVEEVKAATEAYEREQEVYNAVFEAEPREPEDVPDEPEEVEEVQEDPEAKYDEIEVETEDVSDENEDDLPADDEEVTD